MNKHHTIISSVIIVCLAVVLVMGIKSCENYCVTINKARYENGYEQYIPYQYRDPIWVKSTNSARQPAQR